MFSAHRLGEEIPGNVISVLLFGLVLSLLLAQPDIGQAAVVSTVWFSQWFLAGLPMIWVTALGALGVTGLIAAYFVFPHRSEEHTSELQSLMSISYAVFCLKKKKTTKIIQNIYSKRKKKLTERDATERYY